MQELIAAEIMTSIFYMPANLGFNQGSSLTQTAIQRLSHDQGETKKFSSPSPESDRKNICIWRRKNRFP